MIIGICGFIGCGKDTVAGLLVNKHGFERESYASSLKDAVSAVFGWDREMLEGNTPSAREWRETVDEWWAQRLNMPTLTPRWVLQYWGTDVARKTFHDDIWIASLERKLHATHNDIVISDCRFPNEIASIKNNGGKVIWVQRGDLPSWYDIALDASNGMQEAQDEMKYLKVLPSEWAWVNTEFDAVIYNNDSLDTLETRVDELLKVSD